MLLHNSTFEIVLLPVLTKLKYVEFKAVNCHPSFECLHKLKIVGPCNYCYPMRVKMYLVTNSLRKEWV